MALEKVYNESFYNEMPKIFVGGYVRISNDDHDKKESNSITSQKNLIQSYINSHPDLRLYDFYTDDGYTGTNFNRPSFKKLISNIELRNINCVIVKDLSRFGRDYIETGRYLEEYFAQKNIRFISITDNIDSASGKYDLIVPVKNIYNAQYSQDISIKVKAAIKSKQESGKFIGAFACYGYKKDEKDKNKLVIDEYAASIVRRIFSMYLNGLGKQSIARILNEEKIPSPTIYKQENGYMYKHSSTSQGFNNFLWGYNKINKILNNEMYIGNMVQHTSVRQTLRSSKRVQLPLEDRIIVENTHPAIIDKTTWEQTQKLLSLKRKQIYPNTEIDMFAGLLRCGDCGKAMCKTDRNKKSQFLCGSYKRLGKTVCSSHKIYYDTLVKIVLKSIQLSVDTLVDIEETIKNGLSTTTCLSLEANIKKDLENIETQLNKTYVLQKGLYEDFKEKLLSKEQYLMYKSEYELKETHLKNELNVLNQSLDELKNKESLLEKDWVLSLKQYRNITTLDRIVLIELIDTIKVYENNNIEVIFKFSEEMKKLKLYSSNA